MMRWGIRLVHPCGSFTIAHTASLLPAAENCGTRPADTSRRLAPSGGSQTIHTSTNEMNLHSVIFNHRTHLFCSHNWKYLRSWISVINDHSNTKKWSVHIKKIRTFKCCCLIHVDFTAPVIWCTNRNAWLCKHKYLGTNNVKSCVSKRCSACFKRKKKNPKHHLFCC